MYRVVKDTLGKQQYNVGDVISSDENKSDDNEVEQSLERVRIEFNKNLLPRQGAIFVCNSLENAHEWRMQKDKRKLYGYVKEIKYFKKMKSYQEIINEVFRDHR